MKINKLQKIEACVSTDPFRVVLQNPIIDVDKDTGKAVAVSCDGRTLAVVPVEMEDGDAPGYIACDTFEAARKIARRAKKATHATLQANGSVKLLDGTTHPRPEPGNFPNWRQAVPTYEPRLSIALDVELLRNICEAIGTAKVRLEFNDELSPVRIRPNDIEAKGAFDGSYGVLMPMRLH